MELDHYKAAWHGQEIKGDFARGEDEMVEQIRRRMRRFHRKIFWRDVTETLAAILVACLFGYAARYGGTLTQIGAAVVIASAAIIVIVLHTARGRRRAADASLKHGLEGELEAVERQIKLLRNVLYWYIAPLFAGGLLFSVGMIGSLPTPGDLPRGWLYAGGVFSQAAILLVVGYVIWRLNQVAVRRQLLPLRDQIADCLKSLSDEPA